MNDCNVIQLDSKEKTRLENYKIIPVIFFFSLLKSGSFYGQKVDYATVNELLSDGKISEAISTLKKIDNSKLSKYDLAKKNYYLSKGYDYSNLDDLAYEHYLKAKKLYLEIDSTNLAMEINLELAYLLSSLKKNRTDSQEYLKEYIDYANKSGDKNKIAAAFVQFASFKINKNDAEESLFYFHKAKALNKDLKNEKLESKINNNLGVLYSEILKNFDSGMYYYSQDLKYLERNDLPNDLFYNYTNRAGSLHHLNKYNEAIELLKIADTIKINEYVNANKRNLNYYLYINYDSLGDYKNALHYLKNYIKLDEMVNEEELNFKITKLQTKEKEIENKILKNENTLLESKRRTNTLINYSLAITLLFLATLSFLSIKNLRKKQLIAEQEKQIERQKLATILKEQELQNIDLMIESQEKERSRLANELHDNLGSMLATLKINFQNLKRQQKSLIEEENKLYDKTDDLIEEAYQKVRDLAHFKNLGIIGNEGLVPAVKNMADKMSVMNLLDINVIPFGLKDRLDNKLEVSLFRMIQELCTNIIKHANASEVNIYLTQHNGTDINLIIEDNGQGFDAKLIKASNGMGLKNIEKKVEQMGGTFSIDSIPNKGTTIIIDIPL